jgi:hypothetical protein
LRRLNDGAGTKQMMVHEESWVKMRGVIAAAVLLIAVAGALAQPPVPETECAGVSAVVVGANADESEIACDGARAAFAFFAPLDLRPVSRLTIELSTVLPAGAPRDAVACYVISQRRIIALRYEPFSWHRGWFGLAADERLYRAVIAHEVAHAIAACHAGDGRLSLAAAEYVAYVAMIATMPEDHRRELLALHPGSGFDDLASINEFVYAFHPGRFAAESYRHWMHQPDPRAYLRRVIEGGVIQGLAGP